MKVWPFGSIASCNLHPKKWPINKVRDKKDWMHRGSNAGPSVEKVFQSLQNRNHTTRPCTRSVCYLTRTLTTQPIIWPKRHSRPPVSKPLVDDSKSIQRPICLCTASKIHPKRSKTPTPYLPQDVHATSKVHATQSLNRKKEKKRSSGGSTSTYITLRSTLTSSLLQPGSRASGLERARLGLRRGGGWYEPEKRMSYALVLSGAWFSLWL